MANSKRSKHSNQGVPSVDRISALPEPLLCQILSLLPTHCAVQTSILSKRWKHLWTSITSLDFDDELFADPELPYDVDEVNKRFEKFVYRVLVHLKTPFLQKFRLHYAHVRDPFHVNTWTSAALSRDVRELILDVYLPESFELPTSLFTCKTLSLLSLCCDTTLDVPNSVRLPNLKVMYLSSVKYANDESLPKLLSGCPALEDLSVQRIDLDNVFHFSISSPTLKCLDLDFKSDVPLPDSPRYTLRIDAPRLQYLCLDDRDSNDFVIGNLSSLTEADIRVYVSERNNDQTGYGDEVMKLLSRLSSVKILRLSGSTMQALSYARVLVAPDMRNLLRLEGYFSSYKDEGWCIQPDHVPIYLLSRLTTVKINGFDGSDNELQMVKFILKGARSLERMTIVANRLVSKAELLQEITMFPRDSKCCELVVK